MVSVSVDSTGLSVGTYNGTITVRDPNAINSPQTVTVELQVYKPGFTSVPFGDFATPIHGSLVRSSIPVTGWVLDDIEVVSVKIYNGSDYVGDAVFVEGARPDVEQAYPGYPMNYRACWGYMKVNDRLRSLPVGSTLDTERGIFFWQPGVGFLGEYPLIFMEKQSGHWVKRNIIVRIMPKF